MTQVGSGRKVADGNDGRKAHASGEGGKENPDEILSDPNRGDDAEAIVRLLGQVVTVSVETVRLVGALPPFDPVSSAKSECAPEPAA